MLSRSLAAAALVVGLVVAPATVANAATEPFKPSDSKTRAYMLNIVGSVLKGATPDKWRRELLANQNRYNFGLETLDVALNGGKQMNGDYLKNPSSYDDYVIKQYEEELGKKPAKPPATKAAKLEKFVGGVGGAVAAVTSAQFGFFAGKGIASFIGFDTYGLCAPSFEDGGFIAALTGTDCSPGAFDDSYLPNEDFAPGWSTALVDQAGRVHTFTGSLVSGNGNPGWCFTMSSLPGGNQSVYVRPRGETDPTKYNGVVFRYGGQVQFWADCPGVPTTSEAALFGYTPTSGGLDLLNKTPHDYEWSFIAPTASTQWQAGEYAEEDPDRTLTCSVVATDGLTYTETTAAYSESGGALPPPTCSDLPPGVYPANVTVTENGPNGPVELYNEPTTPEYQQWLNDFPQCATGACATDLLDLRGTTPVSCFETGNECADWFADPNKTDNYQCTHGGAPVSLNECYVYAVLFKPGQVDIGAPYADPETGIWSGGQSSPGASAALFGNTVRDPDAQRSCYGQGWAEFNPVEWIMQPIQCALEWAFVPRPAVVALEVAKANESWSTTPPGVLVGTIDGWNVDLSLDGCGGVPLTWRGDTVRMLDACPGSSLAPIASTSHTISGAVFVIGGIFAIISIIAGIIGYRGLTVAGGNH